MAGKVGTRNGRGRGKQTAQKTTGAEKYPEVCAETKWHKWVSDLYAPEKRGSICRILSKRTIMGPGYLLVEFLGGERLICPAEAVVRLSPCKRKNKNS